jgi:uncharacterized CHY-type Zn-finger protein
VTKTIHGIEVVGVDVDPQTRCAHYHSERDIVAIKFKCCGDWFACHQCHDAFAGHAAQPWPKEKFYECAVLCGNCGQQLIIHEYLQSESVCPRCEDQFNSRCAKHHHLYFEMPN